MLAGGNGVVSFLIMRKLLRSFSNSLKETLELDPLELEGHVPFSLGASSQMLWYFHLLLAPPVLVLSDINIYFTFGSYPSVPSLAPISVFQP